MSRPTPETDAKSSPHIGFYSCATVPANFARALEKERDEAREEAAMWALQRDEAQNASEAFSALAWKLEGERNELLNEIQRLRLDAQREAEHHDSMVKELEGLYDKLKS